MSRKRIHQKKSFRRRRRSRFLPSALFDKRLCQGAQEKRPNVTSVPAYQILSLSLFPCTLFWGIAVQNAPKPLYPGQESSLSPPPYRGGNSSSNDSLSHTCLIKTNPAFTWLRLHPITTHYPHGQDSRGLSLQLIVRGQHS